jgi:hypothetical protein
MANVYKTARGKTIDLDKVKLSNETTVAVGNMKVNARGDLLGAGNQIATGRNQVMDRVYAVADDTTVYSPTDPANFQPVLESSSAEKLSNLSNNLTVTIDQTPVATDHAGEETVPTARGSLASSIAGTKTVKQEPIPDPRKPKNSGPTRI